MPNEVRETGGFDSLVFSTRIAGIGPGQRHHVERLQPGDELVLERESGEGGDVAIRVLDLKGNLLGHLASGPGEGGAAVLDLGENIPGIRVIVSHLTEAMPDGPPAGVNVLLFFHPAGDTEAVDRGIEEVRDTIRRDGGIWSEPEVEGAWYPAIRHGEESLDTGGRYVLRNVFMTLVSLLVIVGLLLLVILGIRRPSPDRQAPPPPPVRAAETTPPQPLPNVRGSV